MDSIAAEAGVAKQTVYSHFKDKHSLFSALIDRLLDHFVSAGLTADLLALDARSFIRKIAHITLSRMDDWEYVSLLRLIIGESGRFPELSELYVSHMVKPGIEKLAAYLRANEQVRFSDPEATARIIHGALINFVILQEVMHGKHAMPMSRERLINSVVDMVLFAGEQGKQSS
jgi:AcrR family transcriptional regulator